MTQPFFVAQQHLLLFCFECAHLPFRNFFNQIITPNSSFWFPRFFAKRYCFFAHYIHNKHTFLLFIVIFAQQTVFLVKNRKKKEKAQKPHRKQHNLISLFHSSMYTVFLAAVFFRTRNSPAYKCAIVEGAKNPYAFFKIIVFLKTKPTLKKPTNTMKSNALLPSNFKSQTKIR